MNKLNADFILNAWVPALRSGKYKQGRGQLRSANDEFCCLGVACDLLIEQGILNPWRALGSPGDIMYSIPATFTDLMTGVETSYDEGVGLPEQARTFIGISGGLGTLVKEDGDPWDDNRVELQTSVGTVRSLASANDDGVSFDEIADILERLVEEYA